MTPAEEHMEKALKALQQEKYHEAMINYTKAYNLTGDVRPLMMSSKASIELALRYLKSEDYVNWETFSSNAIDHYEICVRIADVEDIKKMAKDQINNIKALRQKVETVKKNAEGKESYNEGVEHYNKKDYFNASKCFVKSYNISGNTQTLLHAAESELLLGMNYLEEDQVEHWLKRTDYAIQWLNLCIKYADSPEIRQKAEERLRTTEEFRAKYDEMLKK